MTSSRRRYSIAMALLLLTVPAAGRTAGKRGENGLELSGMNRSIPPQQDFYNYANGKWWSRSSIPPERQSWGVFDQLHERNLKILHEILDRAARSRTAGAEAPMEKLGRFYRSAMDTRQIEREGIAPLRPELDRITAVTTVPALQEELARLHRCGVGAGWNFGVVQDPKNSTHYIAQVYQGGLGLLDRDFYLTEDAANRKLREQYVAHVAKMLALLGEPQAQAEQDAQAVLRLETRLARASMTQVQQRDPDAVYHRYELAAFNELTPNITWAPYFTALQLPEPGAFNVAQPEFVRELGLMLRTVPLEEWRTYLRWQLLHAQASRLSAAFVDEDFRFYGTVMTGAKKLMPRWKRMVGATDGALGELLGEQYVRQVFSDAARAKAQAVVENVKAVLRERVATLGWMSEPTRRAALKKLDTMVVKIGYPERWRDYSELQIGDGPFVLNAMRATEFEFQRQLRRVGKPVDRQEWGMTAPTVNAYYNAGMNEIVFPAGILQPPFFHPAADDAVNYGGLGMIAGHELTHAFDDQGRKFDAAGNLKDWWSPEDTTQYSARTRPIVEQYGQYLSVDTIHLNGELTLGENIADIGGLKAAYLAHRRTPAGKGHEKGAQGFTPDQRFFLAFAQSWRAKIRPETLRLWATMDPHSPPRYRVNGPLSRMPEFYRAFNLQPPTDAAGTALEIW